MDTASWDERYAGNEHPWGSAPASALTSRFAGMSPGRAIDLACGDGRHARALTDSGWEVQAVDFSTVAIEVAALADDGAQIAYIVGDVTAWEPAAPVDLVVMSFLHLAVQELVAVVATAGSWLVTGGSLLYLGHAVENHARGVGGPPDPAVLPGIEDLARAAKGMQVVELEHLVRPQGNGQAIDVLLHAKPWD